MDFNALQHKLFAMDPVDPREDIARLRAQAQGSANAPVKETIDYLQESVDVPQGSLQMDKNYSVDDFAALAGVVNEKKQRPADQVRGSEPMPVAKLGRTKHPFQDRLVGEDQQADRIAQLEDRVKKLESIILSNQVNTEHDTQQVATQAKKQTEIPLESIDSIKDSLYAALNKKMNM